MTLLGVKQRTSNGNNRSRSLRDDNQKGNDNGNGKDRLSRWVLPIWVGRMNWRGGGSGGGCRGGGVWGAPPAAWPVLPAGGCWWRRGGGCVGGVETRCAAREPRAPV